MKRIFATALAAVALAGCGGTDPGDVLAETTQNLAELNSGLIELTVAVQSEGEPDGEEQAAGFELAGSFQLPEEGRLPVADLRYTDLAGDEGARSFVSTGDAAYVEVQGQMYELSDEQAATLIGGDDDGASPFQGLSVEEWILDAELSEGRGLDGEEVDRITGDLDVAVALNDLFTLAGAFGAGGDPIEGREAERLDNAVQTATIEVVSGTEDRLLRRLLIEVDLGLDPDLEVTQALGPLAGTGFTLDLSISEPNQAIEVQPPSDALPIEELDTEPAP